MGAVTPMGLSAAESWQAVKDGKCGIAPITQYDCTEQKVKLAAEVKGFVPEDYLDKPEAKTHGPLYPVRRGRRPRGHGRQRPCDLDEARTPAAAASSSPAASAACPSPRASTTEGKERGFDRVSPFYIPMAISNMAAGQIAIRSGFRGMCTCPVTACAGGTNAVGDAFHYIRDGYAEVMLCGGTEAAITPLAIGGFTSMKALSQNTDPTRASIPFDAERSGFVMGEGAGILVLEEYEHAKARGAKIYAEVVGYGATCDAYHITAPAPDGRGGARAMAEALGRRRDRAGGCGLYQRPRHLHPPERRRRDGRRQDGVR